MTRKNAPGSILPNDLRATLGPDPREITGHSHAIVTPELQEMCDRAQQVKEICDAFGIEFRGFRPLIGLLQGADKTGVTLAELVEDPDLRPYIWDLKE